MSEELTTFKERTDVPELGGTATGKLTDAELHEEQWHAAQCQAGEVRQQEST